MKAIVLAAGYATRLYPLTLSVAKPLLPLGGRPLLDRIVDAIDEVAEVDEVHIVTNAKFAASFREWVGDGPVVVHDDGTTSEEDRLGAIGDIRFVLDETGIDDDLLVIAGDNLFDFSLAGYVDWWHGKGEASAVALHDVGDLDLAGRYGVVDIAADGRILSFEEKPEQPRSTLIATAAYVFHRAHVPLLQRYLAEGNSPDQPGRFVAWLTPRVPVYGFLFDGDWRDIGDAVQLLEADNAMRVLAGLEPRKTYIPN
jgi:glucose-1-phosphate thymidylyltransferase